MPHLGFLIGGLTMGQLLSLPMIAGRRSSWWRAATAGRARSEPR